VSLQTIINPGVELSSDFLKEWTDTSKKFLDRTGWEPSAFRKSIVAVKPFLISKGSPTVRWTSETNSTSYLGVTKGALSIRQNLILWGYFKDLSKKIDPSNSLVYWIESIFKASKWLIEKEGFDHELGPSLPLGALAFKDEAAGKVRVFAMVDCWTQWLLKPLHLRLFDVLSSLPTDGTKDQLRPIKQLIDKGITRFWCYDLSAATDRLPVDLQALILSYLMGDDFGEKWKGLLVNRRYYLPKENKDAPRSFDQKYPPYVMYAVGQPMGALSSWAMLALTHHIMVALAARRAGFLVGSFRDYAVLGDDIVIANGLVAREYLIVCNQIGVKVGIHKSLISRKGCLEFAKRFFVRGVDCSSISLLEIGSASRSLVAMLEIGKKYSLSLPKLVAILGYGYKVRGRLTRYITELSPRLRHLAIIYYSPWGVKPLQPNHWLNLRWVVNPMYDVVLTLHEGFESVLVRRVRELRARLNRLRPELRKWLKDPGILFYPSMQKWSDKYEIGSGAAFNEINFVFRQIYTQLVNLYRDDHWDIDQKTYVIANKVNDAGEMGEITLDGQHLIQYNELRHSLALLTRLSNPDERKSTKVVSSAHIWELWKGFPHHMRPRPPRMDGPCGFIMVDFITGEAKGP
jgi:hypothetical protein